MKTLKERTKIQQAYFDGAKIQFMYKVWTDVESPHFDWYETDYRIKPEPMVLYIAIYDNGEKEIMNDGDEAKESGVIHKFIKVEE